MKKKRKKHLINKFIYQNFNKSLEDLKDLKNYFWLSLFLFIIVSLIGFAFPTFFEDEIRGIIKGLVDKTESLGPVELTVFIISNNIFSSFIGMVSGIFVSVPSATIIIVNAYLLGFVANISVQKFGFLFLWRLYPHGIFEIPAILISTSLGIRIGYLLMRDSIIEYNKKINNLAYYFIIILSILTFFFSFIIYILMSLLNKKLRQKFTNNFNYSLRIFILIVVPLLVIAGIIEGVLIYFVK